MILLGILIWLAAAFALAIGFGKFARAGMGSDAHVLCGETQDSGETDGQEKMDE